MRRLLTLTMVAMLPAVPSAAAGDEPRVPRLLAVPGCLVDVDATSRADCLGSSQVTAPATTAPGPCTSVIPLVDDRCEAWIGPRYDGGEYDGAGEGLGSSKIVASSPDGKIAYTLATTDAQAGTGTKYQMAVYAQDGQTGAMNSATRHSTATDTWGAALAADPDGDYVYASGRVAPNGACSTATHTVAQPTQEGATAWTATIPAPDNGCEFLRAIEVDPAGERLFVVGGTTGPDGMNNFSVTAYDSDTGEVAWTDAYQSDSDAGAIASAVAVSPDGSRIYVAGSALRQAAGYPVAEAWVVVAYDAATGARLWTTRWDAPKPTTSHPANPPAAVAVSPNGTRVFLVGGAEGKTLFDVFTLGFDASNGTKLWEADYEGLRSTIKSSFDSVWYHGPLAVSPDGSRVYVASYSTALHGVNIAMDFATLAYDASTGTNLWTTRHTSEQWIHWFPAIAVHPSGNEVYVSGQARHFELFSGRYATLAYGATDGVQKWVARHTDGYSFWGGSTMSPDGKRLFVTGNTADAIDGPQADDYDLLTVGYET